MSETVTVYRASASGVHKIEGCVPYGDGGYRKIGFWAMSHRMGKDYFLDRTEAALRAEELRLRKITVLERQIAKLEATGPHITLFPSKEQPHE